MKQHRGLAVASGALLAIAIAGSALAVGSAHSITLCIVTIISAAAAALAWWNAEPSDARPAATTLLFTGLALTVYTALQCVPLPMAWLTVIAPHNADVWSRALEPLGESGPRWAPLTLDPTSTRVEILRGTAYLLAFVTAMRLARRRKGAALLGLALVATGLALAVAALLHPAFGARRLFGIYEPATMMAERHLAPFLNPNNLAGYLNVALCVALAAGFSREPLIPRSVAFSGALFLGATQLWVASRGGVVAMALGVILVGAFARLQNSTRSSPVTTLSLVAGLAAAAGGTLIVLAGSEDASNELLVGDVTKLTMIARALRMLPAVPLFGCGRGAFESAFPAFRSGTGYVTLAYPENVIAQWVLEWGLPLGGLGLAAVAIALRPSAALARSTAIGGAWAGLVALAVQNLGDMGSEMPGLMIGGVTCAAMVVAGTPGAGSRSRIARWVGSSRVDLQACKLEYSIVSPK